MPTLDEYTKENVIKMLLIGDSGTGKTGALASLAMAGYKLRIIDFDKGVEPIVHAIKKAGKPEALKNVHYQEMDDVLQVVGGNVIPRGVPESFQRALNMLDKWNAKTTKDETCPDFGSPSSWGRDCVLVIDSLTHLSAAAMRYTQAVSGTSGKNPSQPEWGNAQRMIEQMLTLIYSAEFNTNVVVISHITYDRMDNSVDDKGNPVGDVKGNPTSLGRALPPKIPSFFNTMLLAEKEGTGQFTKRVLTTVPNNVINTKSPVLVGIPAKLPIETGLATFFDVALGKSSGSTAVAPKA